MTEKHKPQLTINLLANNWQRKTSKKKKKTRNLDELASEPAIRSCDSHQRITCFESCQLAAIWISLIKLNIWYKLPHQLESLTFHIGFPVVRTDRIRSRDCRNFWNGQITDGPLEKLWEGEGNFRTAGIFFRYQIPCINFFRPQHEYFLG